jgi:GTPase SAR1 family protein
LASDRANSDEGTRKDDRETQRLSPQGSAISPFLSHQSLTTGCSLLVVLIGNTWTGKTSFLSQLQSGTMIQNPVPTIGVDFCLKTIEKNSSVIKGSSFGQFASQSHVFPSSVQIWDTAGQDRYRSIATSYYRYSR